MNYKMKEDQVMKHCELCKDEAAIFCPSDSAFLCFQCDAKVHQANFLVARHPRLTLCSHCNSPTNIRFCLYSPRLPSSLLCPSCSNSSILPSISSSSSSTCVSTTQHSCATTHKNTCSFNHKLLDSDFSGEVNSAVTSSKTCELVARSRSSINSPDPRATAVFRQWCVKLGSMYGEEGAVVNTACEALGICLGRFRALPLRVCLAACLWFGLTSRSKPTRRLLKRLEEMSGVPMKLIMAFELKLRQIAKANKPRRHQEMEESWGEC